MVLALLAMISAERTIDFFGADAPQTGRVDAEKDVFWQLFDTNSCNVNAGDLDGNVVENADGKGAKALGHVMRVRNLSSILSTLMTL